MSDEKTYIFPEGTPTNSTDPMALMAMMGNNGGFGNGN